MKLSCMINGARHEINTNADKPLSLILNELLDDFAITNSCLGAQCGNCLILFNGEVAMSCLIPAFMAVNSEIMTFTSFAKTKPYKDIEKAYQEVGIRPCELCYASKTLLIESILRKIEKNKMMENAYDPMVQSFYAAKNMKIKQDPIVKVSDLMTNIDVNSCKCMEIPEIEKIVNRAQEIRSRKHGRKS